MIRYEDNRNITWTADYYIIQMFSVYMSNNNLKC